MRNFWKKAKKSPLPPAAGGPPSDPCVVTSVYNYSFVKFVSSAKCVLLPSEKNKISTVNVLFQFHPHFCAYFSLQTL